MNKGQLERKKRKQRSAVSRRLLIQYCLWVSGWILAVLLLVFVGRQIGGSVEWPDRTPLFKVVAFVREHIMLLASVPMMIGWIVITWYFISRPLRYLDEVVEAAEQLVSPSEEPIVLSEEMTYTENELNRVREKALNSVRAAREAEQRKNELVVYLAHDLKTPLTSVIGYLTLLRDQEEIPDELRKKYLSISLQKAEHLEDLINEFFEITRFNLSNITLSYSRINLTRMLEQLASEFTPMLLEKELSCELDIPPDLMLNCDVNKMQRVMDNLLRNAVNYSFPQSVIRIVVTQDARELCIRFINQGNTIPPEKLERIFEQFYRLDTARSSNGGGAGLGLAIAKEIVTLHHGRITAASENNQIEFAVVIPLS